MKALEQFVRLNPSESLKKGTLAPYLDMAAVPTSGPSPDDAAMRDCLENGKTAFIQSLQDG